MKPHRLSQLATEMELPYVNVRNLRHAHATLLLAQGENLKLISRRLGHADEATTLRVYAHLLPGTDEEAADQLDVQLHLSNSR